MIRDREGNIWFTSLTHAGVSRYDGKGFKHFMPKDGLSDDMVRTVFQDKSGNIWFGTNGNRKGGLDKYNPKTEQFVNFNETDGLCLYKNNNKCYNGVTCIFEDSKGRMLLGNSLGKLCIYDGETFSTFESESGQTISNVLFALEDQDGNMWFGINYGHLYKYNGETLTDMMLPGS